MTEIKNLTVLRSGSRILNDVTLSMPAGQKISIIGPNGCGKTTLLHTLSRLIPFAEGTITIGGKSITEYKRKELAQKIALLPQFREIPDMSVSDFVISGRYPHLGFDCRCTPADISIAENAMQMTEVSHLADRSLKTLSGGERQRAYIALCLAQGAEILLLDEPTSYLDIKYQFEILNLINKLDGKTVVTVLHDITQALTFSDTVVLMDGGSVIATGTPQEIACSGYIEKVFHVRLDKDSYTVSPQ